MVVARTALFITLICMLLYFLQVVNRRMIVDWIPDASGPVGEEVDDIASMLHVHLLQGVKEQASAAAQDDNSPTFSKGVDTGATELTAGVAATSFWMGPKIVGVGWKKTGTSSLGDACIELGIVPHSFARTCRDPACMDHYASAEDFPVCCDHGLIAAMAERYPVDKVKFVLTERDPESWQKSIDSWVISHPWHECWYSDLMQAKFGKPEFYQKYEEHNAYIRNLFKDTPDRLLVLDVVNGDAVKNMQKFCRFVGVNTSICNKPFPHANAQDYSSSAVIEEGPFPSPLADRAPECSHWHKCSACDYGGILSGPRCPCNSTE